MEIIQYEDKYQEAFKKLNLDWLNHYHLTESHDLMVLDDPRGTIIDRGGYIWLAEVDGEIIGSAALMKAEEGVFELAKMTVAEKMRRRGISKLLIDTCLEKAKELNARKLLLFSNHQLLPAISLYENYGFRHVEVVDTPFETADIKMELDF